MRLRAYEFNVARPAFIHTAGWWVFETGLLPPVLLAHGYVPLAVHGGDSGDWIRSTEVTSPQQVGRARALTASTVEPEITRAGDRPHSGCGADLVLGLVPRFAP